MYKFTVLKKDFVTNTRLAFLKILGTLTENIPQESGLRIAMGGVDWKLQLLKRNSTKDIYLSFSGFSENRRKTFLEACKFYIVVPLNNFL